MSNILRLMIIPSVICMILIVSIIRHRSDQLLHVIFCDVGQGDAIYIRFPGGEDMLVDGGPNLKVLNCLGEHMPFWDRKIDIVLLTHPQKDHYAGLLTVIQRYQVDTILLPAVVSDDDLYSKFISLVEKSNAQVVSVYADDSIFFNKSNKIVNKYIKENHVKSHENPLVSILWPENKWVIGHSQKSKLTANARERYLPKSTVDPNDFSYVILISWLNIDFLLTGDAEVGIVEKAMASYFKEYPSKRDPIEILKVPHHGSEGAVSTSFLSLIRPKVGVLSLGRNNHYGHPHKDVVSLFHEARVLIKRTDENGTIEITTNGETLWYEK